MVAGKRGAIANCYLEGGGRGGGKLEIFSNPGLNKIVGAPFVDEHCDTGVMDEAKEAKCIRGGSA